MAASSVRQWLGRHKLQALEDKLRWAPNLEAILTISSTDALFNGVSEEDHRAFLRAQVALRSSQKSKANGVISNLDEEVDDFLVRYNLEELMPLFTRIRGFAGICEVDEHHRKMQNVPPSLMNHFLSAKAQERERRELLYSQAGIMTPPKQNRQTGCASIYQNVDDSDEGEPEDYENLVPEGKSARRGYASDEGEPEDYENLVPEGKSARRGYASDEDDPEDYENLVPEGKSARRGYTHDYPNESVSPIRVPSGGYKALSTKSNVEKQVIPIGDIHPYENDKLRVILPPEEEEAFYENLAKQDSTIASPRSRNAYAQLQKTQRSERLPSMGVQLRADVGRSRIQPGATNSMAPTETPPRRSSISEEQSRRRRTITDMPRRRTDSVVKPEQPQCHSSYLCHELHVHQGGHSSNRNRSKQDVDSLDVSRIDLSPSTLKSQLGLSNADMKVYDDLWKTAIEGIGAQSNTKFSTEEPMLKRSSAAALLRRSSVTPFVLKNIWELADTEKPRGCLYRHEFFRALKLIALAQHGFGQEITAAISAVEGTPSDLLARPAAPPVFSPIKKFENRPSRGSSAC